MDPTQFRVMDMGSYQGIFGINQMGPTRDKVGHSPPQ